MDHPKLERSGLPLLREPFNVELMDTWKICKVAGIMPDDFELTSLKYLIKL